MQGLEFVQAYIDDLLVITKATFTDHLQKLDQVLTQMMEAGLKINADKSFFERTETEYLGFWVTQKGMRPMVSKIQAITTIATPKTQKQLCRFIGLVNYYRDMWPKRSHNLAPLTRLVGKNVKWLWTTTEQNAFEEIKKTVSREVLLTYPDFSIPFEVHTDASKQQLEAVISQNGKPIAFYSRKLNPAQTRYTTAERELLSIVEMLKEFRNILLGMDIRIRTDHKNLTLKTFNTERVMRWRLIIEEHGARFFYIKGAENVVADILSRITMTSDDLEEREVTLEVLAECFAQETTNEDIYPLQYSLYTVNNQRTMTLLLS